MATDKKLFMFDLPSEGGWGEDWRETLDVRMSEIKENTTQPASMVISGYLLPPSEMDWEGWEILTDAIYKSGIQEEVSIPGFEISGTILSSSGQRNDMIAFQGKYSEQELKRFMEELVRRGAKLTASWCLHVSFHSRGP